MLLMQLFKKIFRLIIFSNLFIALCAAIMVYQANYYFPFHVTFFQLQLFLFFATLTSYSFHWYLTQTQQSNTAIRMVWLLQNRKIHLYLFYIGFIVSATLLFSFVKYWLWFLPAVLLTFLYSAPKLPLPFFKLMGKYIVAKTLLLSTVWAYVTTVLPFIIYGGKWQLVYTLFCLYRFTFITAICILFDIRDKDYDLPAGIQNMVTWFSHQTVKAIFWAMIVLCIIITGTMAFYNAGWQGITAMLLPIAILAAVFKPALKSSNDYLFYFVLDGLMALPAVLLYFLL